MILQKAAVNPSTGRTQDEIVQSRESQSVQGHAERALNATLLRGFGLILSLVVNAILARTLSHADFGRFVLLTSLLLVLCCIARFGLERTIVRFVAAAITQQSHHQYRQSFAKGWTIALVSTCIVIFVWVLIAIFRDEAWLGFQIGPSVIACMGTMIGCGSFLMIASEGFRITKNYFLANLTMAETSSFLIASLHLGFLVLIYMTRENSLELSLTSLTLAMAIPAIWGLICLHRSIVKCQPPTRPNETDMDHVSYTNLLRAGGFAMIIQTITNLTLTCDLWFVERYCSSDELGYFAAAKRMVNLSAVPMSVISASAAASIATYYAQGRSKELQAMLQKLVLYGACPSLLFLIACLLLPSQILELYYGSGYGEGSSILCIMTLGYFLLALVGAAEMSLVMTGQLKTALFISLVAFLSLVIGAVFSSGFGVHGIAWTSAIVLGLRSIAMCVAFGLNSGVWTYFRWPKRGSLEG